MGGDLIGPTCAYHPIDEWLGRVSGDGLGTTVAIVGRTVAIASPAGSFSKSGPTRQVDLAVYPTEEEEENRTIAKRTSVMGTAVFDQAGLAMPGVSRPSPRFQQNTGRTLLFSQQNQTMSWALTNYSLLEGEAVSDFSGRSVALNGDGTIVAIGATENDGQEAAQDIDS